jgi:cytochrome c-type biogenesis protein CcmH
MMKRIVLTVVLIAALALPAIAVQPDEVLSDPALEARARALSLQLRCMVCQNQSIDDSDAPLARDLRILVRERLKAGDTDSQIREFLVARYGQFVLLQPEKNYRTALLWLAPLLVLLAGGLVLLRFFGRPRTQTVKPLTAAERKRLKELS